MNILVIGASGFLGRHLVVALQTQGHQVTGLGSRQADLTRDGALAALDHPRYDQVYHLAAWTQAGDFCLTHGGEQWVINNRINTNVLDWWRLAQPQAKLIALGTSASYAVEEALHEEVYMGGEPNEKFYAYAMSKRMLYAGLKTLAQQYGLHYLYLVPSTLYGPGYHTDGRQLHFIYDLIRKIACGKLYGTPVKLWGDGYQARELIYIDDFIAAACRLAAGQENAIFNLGSGEGHTIRTFAHIICDIVGYDAAQIGYDPGAYVGARSKVLEVAKVRAALGGDPATTALTTGIERTVAWMFAEREFFFPAPQP